MAGTSNCPIAEFDKSDPNCTSTFADIWINAFDPVEAWLNVLMIVNKHNDKEG